MARIGGDLSIDGSNIVLKQGISSGKTTIAHGGQGTDITITLPSGTDTIVGRTLSQTLRNKNLISNNTTFIEDGDNTKTLKFDLVSQVSGVDVTIKTPALAADRIFTLPLATTDQTLLDEATAATLTNKTIDADNNTISNLAHGAEVDDPSSGVHGVTGNVVGTTDAQTLSNKTLTSPLLTGGNNFDVTGAGAVTLFGSLGAATLTIAGATSTVDFPNNVTIQGDLTVTGSTVSAQDLTVTDSTIIVNNGGTDASAEGAGIIVDRVGTDGNLIYEDALASKWKAGAVGSEVELANVSSAQTFSNKTLSAIKYDETNIARATTFAAPSQTIIHLTGTAGDVNTITGGVDGDLKIIMNETGGTVAIKENTGTNGFHTGTGTDLDLLDNASITVIFEEDAEAASDGRWRVIGGVGGGGAGGLGLSTISASGTVSANFHYLVDSSGGPLTLDLPAGSAGDVIRFSDITNTWDTNNVTLDANAAETIDGDLTLVLDVEGVWVQLMWDTVSGEWKVDDPFEPNAVNLTGDLTVDGDLVVTNTAGNIASFPDGLLSAPSISFVSDPDTGIYHPAGANTMSLVTGASHRLTLATNGFVGIDTASPLTQLQVNASPGNEDCITALRESNTISDAVSVNFSLRDSGSADQVYAQIKGKIVDNTAGSEDGSLEFYTHRAGTSTQAVTIDENGNVGIGTSSPSLNIGYTQFIQNDGNSSVAYVLTGGGTTQEAAISSDGNALFVDCAGNATGTNNNIIFRNTSTNSSYSLAERMRITADGNIGIGTTSFFDTDTRVQTEKTGINRFIVSSDSVKAELLATGTFSTAAVGTESNHGFTIKTNSVDRISVDTSGNVGIGVNSPAKVLHVKNEVRVSSSTAPNDDFIELAYKHNETLSAATSSSAWGIGNGVRQGCGTYYIHANGNDAMIAHVAFDSNGSVYAADYTVRTGIFASANISNAGGNDTHRIDNMTSNSKEITVTFLGMLSPS